MRLPILQSKLFIFATCYGIWAFPRVMICHCSGTIQRATPCIEWDSHIISGQKRTKHIDIRKHFAHEVIQHMRLIRRHLHQGVAIPTIPALFIGLMGHKLEPKGPRAFGGGKDSSAQFGGRQSRWGDFKVEPRWPFGGVLTVRKREGPP